MKRTEARKFDNSPRVIRVRYTTRCRETGRPLNPGDNALYFPSDGYFYAYGSQTYLNYHKRLMNPNHKPFDIAAQAG